MLLADLIPHGDPNVNAFVVLMLVGLLVGIAGHISKSPTLVIIGIGMVFLATVALPLVVFGSGD